jgi:hypothetical protein
VLTDLEWGGEQTGKVLTALDISLTINGFE